MLDEENNNTESTENQTAPDQGAPPAAEPSTDSSAGETTEPAPAKKAAARKSTAKKATKSTAKKTTPRKTAAKKAAAGEPDPAAQAAVDAPTEAPAEAPAESPEGAEPAPAKTAKSTTRSTAKKATTKKTAAKKTAAKKAPATNTAALAADEVTPPEQPPAEQAEVPSDAPAQADTETSTPAAEDKQAAAGVGVPLFQAPDATAAPKRRTRKKAAPEGTDGGPAPEQTSPGEPVQAPESGGSTQRDDSPSEGSTQDDAQDEQRGDNSGQDENDGEGSGSGRRRRRRGGRRRRKGSEGGQGDDSGEDRRSDDESGSGQDDAKGNKGNNDGGKDAGDEGDGDSESGGSRRRRRRRRAGEDGPEGSDDPQNTVTKVRKGRSIEDEITAVSGSTRLEAKKQRRREGREAGRRRVPIVSEAEFLARRESVERTMVIRQRDDLTQIGVLEDKVLVEHYVARESQTSLIGNVYVGRVQNVLPSMEAAFIDIGKGRNAVLYAGEVNWSALGHKDGQPRKIESVLSSGQSVLVQVTKDPIGHKGARLTSQISLAGRFLVYVPDGTTSGISRKLPDTERSRLKSLLKEIVPDSAGVIVRTAAEGASEEELTRDVERLKARWEDIEKGAKGGGSAPKLLYGEPDLTLKVVRDLFTEDFAKLVIEGDDAWQTVQGYVAHVAPDLEDRLEQYTHLENEPDVFAAYRIDEQIAKGLDRKVWLPSGGSLIIDRTEAMTVVDVNTGKFTGSGGNLEETVTKNNLEAAEEIVRQLRLRDIGGIIVIDFIDMVLESNRDLVLRRLVECLGRDRTRHQVAEVTSLGLVQMTRKRIGTGLLEAFSESCDHCAGRGLVTHDMPVEPKRGKDDDDGRGRGRRGGRNRNKGDKSGNGNNGGNNDNRGGSGNGQKSGDGGGHVPSPKDVAAVAKPENADKPPLDEQDGVRPAAETKPDAKSGGKTDGKSTPPASEPKAQPQSEPQSEPQPEPTPEPTPEPQAPAASAAAAPVTDAAPEPTPEPEAPKVVTRTRRAASRRTGTSLTPATVTVAPSAPAPDADAPAPEPAKVTVTTRTRGSRRAAGSSAASADTAAKDTEGTGVASGAEPVDAEAPETLHVPIKPKGSRKR